MPCLRFSLLIALALAGRAAADEETYDLVLRNGTIVDGSGNPWSRGDVAIRGDRLNWDGGGGAATLIAIAYDSRGRWGSMTEAEWLACEDPDPMLACIQDKASERKVRL